MASQSKKRKLEESKAPARNSNEHLLTCIRGLFAAASQDPTGWCHIGKEKANGGVDVYAPSVAKQMFPLPDDIPFEAILIASEALKIGKNGTVQKVVWMLGAAEKLVPFKEGCPPGLINLKVRNLSAEDLKAAQEGTHNKPASVNIETFKLPGLPLITLPLQ